MEHETFESFLSFCMSEHLTQSFFHENEKKGGEWISLSYALGGIKRFCGDAIEENGKKGHGYETDLPMNPRKIKTKG